MTTSPGTGNGGRPKPKVAMPSRGPRYDTSSGNYSGSGGSKSPSGSRPVPTVARNVGKPHGGKPGAGVKTPRVTSMPAPKQKATTRKSGKAHGG